MSGANGINGGGQAQPSNPYMHTGSLEPLAMLQAYRAGQPLANPSFQRPAQFLPQALPVYNPPPQPVQPNPLGFLSNSLQGSGWGGGDGSDGGAANAAADAAAAASANVGPGDSAGVGSK